MDERAVAEQYERPDLLSRILTALRASGVDPDRLTTRDLASVDEFHTGGRAATTMVLGEARPEPGMRVLDVGCGIGGAARALAEDYRCEVFGIDLTTAYVEAARGLTKLAGLDQTCRFAVASATGLPFAERCFDALYCIHVAMNIADRNRLAGEFGRVLRADGTLVLFDVVRKTSRPLTFPLPWAEMASASILLDLDETLATLRRAGFRVRHTRSLRDFAVDWFERQLKRPAPAASAPGIHLLTGANTREKLRNYHAALAAGDLDPVIIVARAAA
ncbi:MAG: methyltransferase domain-containing protein [Geminicoccaceae bacterium]